MKQFRGEITEFEMSLLRSARRVMIKQLLWPAFPKSRAWGFGRSLGGGGGIPAAAEAIESAPTALAKRLLDSACKKLLGGQICWACGF